MDGKKVNEKKKGNKNVFVFSDHFENDAKNISCHLICLEIINIVLWKFFK